MSPTLLEGLAVIVLIAVAWQLGLLLAPTVRRSWRDQMRALDDASDDGSAEANRLNNQEETDHVSQ